MGLLLSIRNQKKGARRKMLVHLMMNAFVHKILYDAGMKKSIIILHFHPIMYCLEYDIPVIRVKNHKTF
jgi:hypothetical protein